VLADLDYFNRMDVFFTRQKSAGASTESRKSPPAAVRS
jgi:hypothetical protein